MSLLYLWPLFGGTLNKRGPPYTSSTKRGHSLDKSPDEAVEEAKFAGYEVSPRRVSCDSQLH